MNDVMMMSSLCFSKSVYKTCQRQPTELKLGKLIVYSKLHKICKFVNHVTRNDIIMASLPKIMGKQWGNVDLCETNQIIYHSKGIDESNPKMYFLLNWSHYVKSCGHFCQILALFLRCLLTKYHIKYHVMLPRKQISKNFAFNIRKSYKISGRKALYFRSYQPKNLMEGWKTPPPHVLLGLTDMLLPRRQ